MAQKQKILYLITKGTWGGAQRYVSDLATHIAGSNFEPVVAYGEPGRLVEMLSSAHVATYRISQMGRDISILSDIGSFFQILLCLWRIRPDVVHLNSSKAAALGALASQIMRVPRIIFTVHGWPFKEDRGFVGRWVLYAMSWITALLSHRVIVVSTADQAQGNRMWLVSHKIHYVPIGIEATPILSKDAAYGILSAKIPAIQQASDAPRVITIAELTANKGIGYAIRAIAHLQKKGVRVVYIVIGAGEESGHLKSLARAQGVEDRVFFVGFLESAAQYLSAADIFLLPSIKEGMPYVLLEAAHAGLPIVTTTAVNPDFIASYERIRAVRPADPEALSDAIVETIRSREESTLFRTHLFGLEDMIARTATLYGDATPH